MTTRLSSSWVQPMSGKDEKRLMVVITRKVGLRLDE